MERFDRVAQARALGVLIAHDVPYDENDNGVFVNMSVASPTAVVELEKYVDYVRLQQEFLAERESERHTLLDNYFKGGDDVHEATCSGSSTETSSRVR